MIVKELKGLICVSRIIVTTENYKLNYVLWNAEEGDYRLEFPLDEFSSLDLFENHGEQELLNIVCPNIDRGVIYLLII